MEPDFGGRYRAAKADAVVFDRARRGRLLVSGRAPGQMLGGVLTGRIPTAPVPTTDPECFQGSRAYSAMLTPKGKMLSDLYVYRLPGDEEFLLDVPVAGLEAVLGHFTKVLPPRLARFRDASADYGMVTVAGPRSFAAVAALTGSAAEVTSSLLPDETISSLGAVIARSTDLSVPSFDIMIPMDRWDAAREALLESGVDAAPPAVWDVLRLEAGTPEFGVDMNEDTIPIEAGIDERAIDHDKGCYTGQEVVVRIRHRGHVNRHLRTLLLSSTDAGPGDQLFQVGQDKAVGSITSRSWSPDLGRPVALGYVRREVEPGSEVRVGGPAGSPASVRERGRAE